MASLSRPFARTPARAPRGRPLILLAYVFATLALLGSAAQSVATAQDKGDAVFDEKKSGDAQKTPEKKPSPKTGGISDRDAIGFTQENVAAQMTELEERMFRLSEALRSLEPENASRLKLALNFSREELILLQMKETQSLLRDAQLNKAETEVRELLAKLEHLRSLLLAEDLDFQMKLARLRQMRETLNQLDRIIKEERRELSWSRSAVAQQASLERMRGSRSDLEGLVRDQETIVRDLRAALPADAKTAPQDARDAATAREAAVKKTAERLAGEPLFAEVEPPYLRQADPHLGDAIALLATPDTGASIASAERGLELFRKELERLAGRTKQSEAALAAAEFQRLQQDQSRNRGAADALGETSARLGDSGVALQKDLIRAGSSMQAAESDLARIAAQPASEDQVEALKHLLKSRAALAGALETLLVELRSELQSRIITELTEMHEIQADLRETTQAQAPRVAQRSRTALVLVVGLSRKESELGDRTEHLRALVQETEFGIALPTALGVLAREMRKIEEWLGQGDASPRTVTLEKRVEDDLLGLLEAIRRLPPSTPPAPGTPLPTEPRARERELNRLIAELKMIRLLQFRLNDDTLDVDHTRPGAPTLTPELKREIETLKAQQEEIRDSIAKLSARFEPKPDDP
jgi:hypothetical protein